MYILGAGLAGCIAAHLFPGAHVLEAASREGVGAHRALLRFRSDDISKITGIPFRRVRVTKAVIDDRHVYCSDVPLSLLNAYSRKVSGKLQPRSIGDIAPVDRWVAPDDFHAQLVEQLRSAISFDFPIARISATALWGADDERGIDRTDLPVLSTVPLPVALKLTGMDAELTKMTFQKASIFVARGRVKNCDVHQTCYFPSPQLGVYRASITGAVMIVECVNAPPGTDDLMAARNAF